jgi:hypothetical protein
MVLLDVVPDVPPAVPEELVELVPEELVELDDVLPPAPAPP